VGAILIDPEFDIAEALSNAPWAPTSPLLLSGKDCG
jgi:hypothetical protein